MSDDYEDEDVSEIPEFSAKSEFSKARLAEKFIQKVCELRSMEMREGYYNTKFDKEGNSVKVWVEDARKVYCSSVEALTALMSPEIYADQRAINALKEFEKRKEAIEKFYIYKDRIRCVLPGGEGGWKYTGKEFMPRIDEKLPVEHPQYPKSGYRFEMVAGIWNGKVNAYWDELIKLYDILFAEINFLIGSKSINYFKSKASF